MNFTNAQKLAAVVTIWSRPAVSQLASSRICQLPMMASFQNQIITSGLVAPHYRLQKELEPYIGTVVQNLTQPMLEEYFSKIPDASIPTLAKAIVSKAMEQPQVSFLDGIITFERSDMEELMQLLEKNFETSINNEEYKVIR